jgi:hypothetical protein
MSGEAQKSGRKVLKEPIRNRFPESSPPSRHSGMVSFLKVEEMEGHPPPKLSEASGGKARTRASCAGFEPASLRSGFPPTRDA